MRWNTSMAMAVVAALLSTIGFTDAAVAQPSAYKNYARAGIGLNQFSGDLEDWDDDVGVNVAVAYGRYLTPYLVAEAAVDLFAAEGEAVGSTPSAGNYERDDSAAVVAILGTLKGELPAGPLRIFGGGGIGYYVLALNSDITTTNLGDLEENTSDGVFGVHVVAGVNADITERLFIGIEGLYRWTDDIDIHEAVATVPVRLEGNLDGYTITLSAGFRF